MYASHVADGRAGGIALDLADGRILHRWDACYRRRRTGAAWRHFAIFDTAPPRPDSAAWVR